MESILLLLVCAILGILSARFVRGAVAFAQPLNWWVLNIALPALVLELIPKLELGWHLWFLPVSQWLVFLGSWCFFAMLGKLLHWTPQRVGGLTLVAGLGNTMFVAYPVIEAVLGRDALPYAVVADQAGAFIAFTIGGVFVVAVSSGTAGQSGNLLHSIAQRLLRFPALYAIAIGLFVGALGGWPMLIDNLLLRLGSTLTPLALFSAGLQFRLYLGRGLRTAVATGLAWKLVLAPILIAAIGWMTGTSGTALTVGILQAAMPPMISAAILASQHDLEPGLVNTVLALGILVSIVTLPLAVVLL